VFVTDNTTRSYAPCLLITKNETDEIDIETPLALNTYTQIQTFINV